MRMATLLSAAALALPSFADAGEAAKTTLAVNGMTSGACVAAVRVQLKTTEGVTAYEVSLEKGEADLTYDPTKTEPKKIAESVSRTGFEAKPKDELEGESSMRREHFTSLVQSAEAAMPGLSSEEQRAGIVLLRELAKGEPVAVPQFAQALGVPINEAAALVNDSGLSRLIFTGEDGRVAGVWGLSTAQTHHKFTINGRTLWAWCAGDTLFLPEVLDQTAAVESRDPESGDLVRLTISPARVEAVEPKDVIVSFLAVGQGQGGLHIGYPDHGNRVPLHLLIRLPSVCRALGGQASRKGGAAFAAGGHRPSEAPERAGVRNRAGAARSRRPVIER